jgi:hypothetical protein
LRREEQNRGKTQVSHKRNKFLYAINVNRIISL